jgi:hypothetical protein
MEAAGSRQLQRGYTPRYMVRHGDNAFTSVNVKVKMDSGSRCARPE